MGKPIYLQKLGLPSHRLLWWLLAHQGVDAKGAADGIVPTGWREKAMKELALYPAGMWKAQTALKKAGVIEFVGPQKTRKLMVKINGDAFRV